MITLDGSEFSEQQLFEILFKQLNNLLDQQQIDHHLFWATRAGYKVNFDKVRPPLNFFHTKLAREEDEIAAAINYFKSLGILE